MNNIKNILFDNDGTLYDVPPNLKELFFNNMGSYLSRKIGLSFQEVIEERKKLITKYQNSSTEWIFNKEYNVDIDEFIKEVYSSMNLEESGIRRDERLYNLLTKIKFQKSVLTNNPSEFARKILASLGINVFFQYVLGSKEVDYQLKPNRNAYLKAESITGYPFDETVFVDDKIDNLVTAKQLGMRTILLSREHRINTVDSNIDIVITSIYDLNEALDQND